MTKHDDAPHVIVHPPIALALALILAFILDRVHPLGFVAGPLPRIAGFILVAAGLLLAFWAASTFQSRHTAIPTNRPATMVVEAGPYRFSRNPIYSGMFLGLLGLALGFDTLWLVVALVLLYPVIRYGVIAREERYLEGKFGSSYLAYKARVRRWL